MALRDRWIDPDGTISVSDLAEYAYCPRALYYRYNPPETGADPAAARRAHRGSEFHARQLARVYRRESNARSWGILFVAAAIGLSVLAAAWAFGWS